MKAIIYRAFGEADVLEWVDDWPEPEPGEGEVKIRVLAGALNPKDILLRKGKFRPLLNRERLPRVSGQDVAGEVVSVGSGVSDFSEGDAVFGMTNRFHGGAHAQFAILRDDEIAHCPKELDWSQAAAIPLAAQTALQALRDCAHLKDGHRVLINGASGGVGHFAVQIARILGAEVTAVCGESNLHFVSELGADHVIDYHQTPAPAITGPFDCVFDVFGQYRARDFRDSLKPDGVYVNTIPNRKTVLAEGLARLHLQQSSRLVLVHSNRRDLEILAGWVADGNLHPHLDKVYPFYHVEDAHRHIETRHTRGKVVLEASC